MVATQVLISLCVAGLTAAAPQLNLPGIQRPVSLTAGQNEETIVTNVVTALQPSIAEAVANALRSLQTTSTITTTSNGANTGFSAGSGFSSSSSSSNSGSRGSSFQAEKASFEKELQADLAANTRAEYNFEFKVADEDAQTYISQNEQRDGDDLTGTYSYVDPNGALITVNYQAGPMGYTQTLDKQEGFVSIRAQPVRASSAGSSSSSSTSSSSSGSRFSGGNRFSGATGGVSVATQSAAVDQSALIAQIVSALQPQISASVNAALASSQQRTVSVTSVPVATAVATRSSSTNSVNSGDLGSVFGDGYNVKIATPEFNVEY